MTEQHHSLDLAVLADAIPIYVYVWRGRGNIASCGNELLLGSNTAASAPCTGLESSALAGIK